MSERDSKTFASVLNHPPDANRVFVIFSLYLQNFLLVPHEFLPVEFRSFFLVMTNFFSCYTISRVIGMWKRSVILSEGGAPRLMCNRSYFLGILKPLLKYYTAVFNFLDYLGVEGKNMWYHTNRLIFRGILYVGTCAACRRGYGLK